LVTYYDYFTITAAVLYGSPRVESINKTPPGQLNFALSINQNYHFNLLLCHRPSYWSDRQVLDLFPDFFFDLFEQFRLVCEPFFAGLPALGQDIALIFIETA